MVSPRRLGIHPCNSLTEEGKEGDFIKKRITAHELYEIIVGEYGVPRHEFLYDLRLWEILAIQRGGSRRSRANWEAARFIAFTSAKAAGAKSLQSMRDMLTFPWEEEDEDEDEPTDEEIEAIRQQLQAENSAK